jgi:hypothetical protein
MPFGVKNGPLTFYKAVGKAFRKNLDQFMKIFLDDFIIYNDMENHLMKLRLCCQKCKKYRISFNPKKCAFMVCVGLIYGSYFPRKEKYKTLRRFMQ